MIEILKSLGVIPSVLLTATFAVAVLKALLKVQAKGVGDLGKSEKAQVLVEKIEVVATFILSILLFLTALALTWSDPTIFIPLCSGGALFFLALWVYQRQMLKYARRHPDPLPTPGAQPTPQLPAPANSVAAGTVPAAPQTGNAQS